MKLTLAILLVVFVSVGCEAPPESDGYYVQPGSSSSRTYHYQYQSSSSSGAPRCAPERAEKRRPGLVGAFIPRCDREGHYSMMQCHGSTGYCWCVDRVSGTEIPGTRTGPGRDRPECRQIGSGGGSGYHTQVEVESVGGGVHGGSSVVDLDREYENMYRGRPCDADRNRPRAAVVGLYIPQCDTDGLYRSRQCHTSTGQCWCVERGNNVEKPGTRRHATQVTHDMCGDESSSSSHTYESTHSSQGGRQVPIPRGPVMVGEPVYVEGFSAQKLLSEFAEIKMQLHELKQSMEENSRVVRRVESGRCDD